MDRIYRLIKLNRLVRSHRVKFLSVLAAHTLKMRHLFLRFDPVMACNLRCTMCYFSDEEYRKTAKGIFKKEEIERIAGLLFPKTLQLVIGCGTEPTLYKDFTEIIRLGKSHNIPFVGFTSNGMLFTDDHLSQFVEYGLDELALSVHGVQKETYERFMVNASFGKFIDVLERLDALKKAANVSTPNLRVNYTVNSENLEELRGFFDVFGKYSIRTLQVRPVMDIGGTFRTPLGGPEIETYRSIVSGLAAECKRRNITLLANTADPSYEQTNENTVILEAVKRYISPQVVWRKDFNWRNESYDAFCKRIGWSGYLLKNVFSNREKLPDNAVTFSGKYAARYEVSF
ncbi:MAG: radical SAM protein [Bacteroidetes bacterium]|nr:radical SAM protein [Bacteroidota bacterium]MCW5896619.1 radical SAM protein [Bacteroidota bacterium]